jgi:hypothetical protein
VLVKGRSSPAAAVPLLDDYTPGAIYVAANAIEMPAHMKAPGVHY